MPFDRTSRFLAAAYWTLAVLLSFAIGERWRYDDGLRLAAWRNATWSGLPAYEDLDARLSNDLIGRVPFTLWPAHSIEWTGYLATPQWPKGRIQVTIEADTCDLGTIVLPPSQFEK